MIVATKRTPWTFTEKFCFAAFLLWSVAGLIFTVGRITPASIGLWPVPKSVCDFVITCLLSGDPILIILAFANTHLHCARQWSDGIARRWAFIILFCSFAIETCGAITGIPFGDYHYTDRFGPMIGVIPATIPLAWHVIITNALFLVRAIYPHVSSLVEALTVGIICTLYDLVLEPFATTVKGYWAWNLGSPPAINYVAWFVLSTLLVRIFAPTLSNRFRFDPRPLLVLAFTVLIFIAGEVASLIYR